MSKPINFNPKNKLQLKPCGSWPKTTHIFDDDSCWAIGAAVAAQRPLLIRGEPGTGKSQLARAAAQHLGRLFISEVINARTEGRDLQYRFDTVSRLAEAQVNTDEKKSVQQRLDPNRFLSPGVLWWTLNWTSANAQFQRCEYHLQAKPQETENWSVDKGCVLLIDEIDKADAELPNSLLETLGNGGFQLPYQNEAVTYLKGIKSPLVIITTNEERELPAAFVRRCLVLHLNLPSDEADFIDKLTERGEAHYKDLDKEVLKKAAKQLYDDRQQAQNKSLPKPGQAEYLDLLRAISELSIDQKKNRLKKQKEMLNDIKKFTYEKHHSEM